MLNIIVVFSKTKPRAEHFPNRHRENYSTGTLADDCHGGIMLKIEILSFSV